jgi:hypothetical protein
VRRQADPADNSGGGPIGTEDRFVAYRPPEQPYAMHQADPPLCAQTVINWAAYVLAETTEEENRADH